MGDTATLRRAARNQTSKWLRALIPALRRDFQSKGSLTVARTIAIARAELRRRDDGGWAPGEG